MPFIPHTRQDIIEMLSIIGAKNTETLFDEIPNSLRQFSLKDLPVGLSEMEVNRIAKARAKQDGEMLCFLGAGAYEHYIPAIVFDIATRGEFYTAYTPYQAEASQGSLQLIYEYQTMMANLMALEVSNASLYDGASSLAEAILMAVRLSNKKGKTSIILPKSVHPYYQDTVKTILAQQDIHLVPVSYQKETGRITFEELKKCIDETTVALVIPQPNFFGVIEEVDALADFAHEKGLLSIAVVNPLAMSLLKPPGQWGKHGVDIACGEGQSLGVPLSGGGPYYGFLCCNKPHVRQMPGRIVGRTIDLNGKTGFVLTLQAREQHIRRAKATSNICTNQGLMVTASTIYMSLMGAKGLRHIAMLSHQRTSEMRQALLTLPHVQNVFNAPFFHEIVLRLNKPVEDVVHRLAALGIQCGYILKDRYPELGDCLLLSATETKSQDDIQFLASQLRSVLQNDTYQGSKKACQA